MEANREEALKAIEIAEKRFAVRDFAGAKNYAVKAKTLCPGLEGISQMVATFDVYIASEVKHNGELDYYSILGLKPFADKEAVKKQYKKLAVLLHPDKNKCVGADEAFKLVSEAWTWLSDSAMRSSYDLKRNAQLGSHGRLDTFWTICTSCKVQYEYLRKYVNKRLSCKNCRGTFVAVETGAAPANGSFPYCPWSYVPGNGYGSHSFDGVTYVPTSAPYFNGNGVTGYHSGHGYEYVSNVSFQWGSAGVVNQNGSTTLPADSVHRANGHAKRGRPKVKTGADKRHHLTDAMVNTNSDAPFSYGEPQEDKLSRPDKKQKVAVGASFRNGYEEKGSKCASEKTAPNVSGLRLENGKAGPISITVPDSDFHDFDKDRSEECFKPKQIWALYDEEDGMPRLYCMIREVVSVNPFKIHISYLSSKTDNVVDHVNIFSHVLSQEKAGRGGCVRIYPRSGDIWAVYRNWSPDWNRSTPDEVRHQYEMVEVLDDYSEELGVCVSPLIKLAGFKTVYQRNTDKSAIKWIPRREMLRFSHQVPSWLLKGAETNNLPERCWDLDPAATPDELLHAATATEPNSS
uniref:Chaperone protein dnaJ 49 n=1 Tax=Cajanus cajan TaxID=3821 RepID=A0A151U2H1_CAJCA|nr:Chaperone protein dnaJ 49 [Cajanus cajan]